MTADVIDFPNATRLRDDAEENPLPSQPRPTLVGASSSLAQAFAAYEEAESKYRKLWDEDAEMRKLEAAAKDSRAAYNAIVGSRSTELVDLLCKIRVMMGQLVDADLGRRWPTIDEAYRLKFDRSSDEDFSELIASTWADAERLLATRSGAA
jgi:hypothetical protein